MTIIVTGGAGFIGANFIFHMMKAHPDYRLVCLDKLTYAGNLSTLAPVMDEPNFRFAKLDICDREGVYRLFEEEHPDMVVNFAAESHVDRSIENPEVFLQTNILGTQVLMDVANRLGGLVIGTGDLSELALGWATYNGDHMSMYGVNASIPKTLVRHLVRYAADTGEETLRRTLLDILDTPVSPELLPPVDGEIAQKTEDLVGPYELHDFFLYYMLRFNFSPGKIYRMARRAFAGRYAEDVIKKWLRTFYWRFFAQQFKRSCLPDGPKVGSVTLSPRGDWRMPSDASVSLWMEEIETL